MPSEPRDEEHANDATDVLSLWLGFFVKWISCMTSWGQSLAHYLLLFDQSPIFAKQLRSIDLQVIDHRQ